MIKDAVNEILKTVPVSTIMQRIFMQIPERKIAIDHMYSTFYKLTQEYPDTFDFNFHESGCSYNSGELESTLFQFGCAGVLHLRNNEKYVVPKKEAQTIKTNFENKLLDSDVKYAIDIISKDFVAFLNGIEAKAKDEQELDGIEEKLLERAPMRRQNKRR